MNENKKRFQGRALTSWVIAFSFLVLAASGTVLFVAPPGRIANWSGWNILGLSKHQWMELHASFAALFVLAVIFHLLFNWRPMMSYLKDRLTRRLGFRWEWPVALLLCGAVFAGTRAYVPPFSSLLSWGDNLKRSWEAPGEPAGRGAGGGGRGQGRGGGRAWDQNLGAAEGIRAAAQLTPTSADAAPASNTAPATLRTADGQGKGSAAAGPGAGWGRKTLAEACAQLGLDLKEALARLEARGIQADARQTLREIALGAGYDRPSEIVELLGGRPHDTPASGSTTHAHP